MRVLIFGKIPPIQGGVSRATWVAARALCAAGHRVDVISNGEAMAKGFRQMLSVDDRAVMAAYEKRGLVVHMTEPVPPSSYIPWAMPFLSQMIGKAIGLCAAAPPDIILGWYFEPYGVAAHLIGQMTGRPVVLQHAGSDLGRLMNYSDLRALYSHMLSQAAGIITGAKPDVIKRLTEAGADPNRLCRIGGSTLDPEFNAAEKLDLAPLVEEAERWFADYGLPDDVLNTLIEWNRAGLSCDDPVIGTYGKIAEVKGVYSLIDALDRLAGQGVRVAYHALWSASPKRFAHAFRYLSAKKALKGRSVILPPLPPWRVPAFIKSCSAVAFLENRFPIGFHSPQIPREVLACGRPLIVSGEIYDKQYFKDQLVDGVNVMRVEDPENQDRLCDVLRKVVLDEQLRNSLSHHGRVLSRVLESGLPDRPPIVGILERLVGSRSRERTVS